MPHPPQQRRLEKPIRTALGFAGIALGAKVVHQVRFERSAVIPTAGAALVLANHLATTETLAFARLVIGHRRFPHFLAKSEIFTWPVVGRLLTAARQIPVLRGTAKAADSLKGATAELELGHLVTMYPEGRLTREPDLRPGPGRTGAARLALAHPDVPVIPVGMWGPRPGRRHIWHRHRVDLVVGEALDLSSWAGRTDAAAAREATELIMTAIELLVEQARGEPFDPPPVAGPGSAA